MKRFFDGIFGGLDTGLIVFMLIAVLISIVSHAFGWKMDHAGHLMMGMAVLTQGDTLQDILKFEMENSQSRELVMVDAGQTLTLGAVIGKITKGTCPATGTNDEGNTGAGACGSVTAGIKAKVGTYTLKCILAQAGAGIFSVEDPEGYGLPDAVVGVAYVNDQINFTLSDGSPDFIVGDSFTIAIPAGSGNVKEIDFDAVDGTADAYGFLTADCTAVTAIPAVAIVRESQVIEAKLVWPATSPAPSSAEKAAAMAQLAAKGIVTRTEV